LGEGRRWGDPLTVHGTFAIFGSGKSNLFSFDPSTPRYWPGAGLVFRISLLFVVSGSTGLAYEVLWGRLLGQFLGESATAHTVVLASFLGGLAAGNAWFGPRADRSPNPLRTYGWLEIGIAAFGAISPLWIEATHRCYIHAAAWLDTSAAALTPLKLLFAVLTVFVPATLMGGTLPSLARYAVQFRPSVRGAVAWLYAVNSAGAVVGAVVASFVLLPMAGIAPSLWLVAAMNAALGLLALYWAASPVPSLSPEASAPVTPQTDPNSSAAAPFYSERQHAKPSLILLAAAASGMASLSYEIGWIRLLSLTLGSSTYSFGLMLAAFITGIALGSLIIERGWLLGGDPLRGFAIAQFGIVVGVLCTFPLYDRLPFWFMQLKTALPSTEGGFALFLASKSAISLALVLVPTVFIGMTLPLATDAVTGPLSETGRRVGLVFSANTAGNVVGATVAGLWLLPWLGFSTLIVVTTVLNAAIGGFCLVHSIRAIRWFPALAACAGTILAAAAIGVLAQPDPLLLTAGAFRSRAHYDGDFDAYRQQLHREAELLFIRDGRSMNVAVQQARGANRELSLRVNGKPDASTGHDMGTQLLLGHVPLFLVPKAKDVLVIGLGSGVTLGAVLAHPVERVDVVEIAPEVLDASRLFAEFSGNALDDPRVSLHIADAKEFVQITRRRYDVIISEPSNPWVAGTAGLFSQEFHRDAQKRLRSGGVFAQWFHAYEASDDMLRMILRTLTHSFPHTALWRLVRDDYLLAASSTPVVLDIEGAAVNLMAPRVQTQLAPYAITEPTTMLSLQTATDTAIRSLAGIGTLIEDHRPRLEYIAARMLFSGHYSGLLAGADQRWRGGNQPSGQLLLAEHVRDRGQPLALHEYVAIDRSLRLLEHNQVIDRLREAARQTAATPLSRSRFR